MAKESKDTEVKVEYNENAYSFCRIELGLWHVVKVQFDSKSGLTSKAETVKVLTDEPSAVTEFRILVAQDLMMKYRR